MKIGKTFIHQLKLWFIFNVMTFPFIALFYVPYNLFWLQYTTIQLLKWFLTAGVMGAFFNLFYRPFVARVTHFLDKRYGKVKPVEQSPNQIPVELREAFEAPIDVLAILKDLESKGIISIIKKEGETE